MPKKPKHQYFHDALHAAQATIGSISKDARNDFQHYDYVSAETMITECRSVLLDNGIVMSAGDVECIPFASGDHGDAVLVRQTTVFSFKGEHPEIERPITVMKVTRDWPAVPQKGRPLDKAVASALTAGLSYTLRDFLLIPRIDDGRSEMDHSSRQPKPHHRPVARTTQETRVSPGEVAALVSDGSPSCPACGSRVWDNRETATGSQPLWSCSNKEKCPGGKGNFAWGSWDPDQFGTVPKKPPAAEVRDERGDASSPDNDIPF